MKTLHGTDTSHTVQASETLSSVYIKDMVCVFAVEDSGSRTSEIIFLPGLLTFNNSSDYQTLTMQGGNKMISNVLL